MLLREAISLFLVCAVAGCGTRGTGSDASADTDADNADNADAGTDAELKPAVDAGPPYRVPAFTAPAGAITGGLGRGLAIADFDLDGVMDLLAATSDPAIGSGSTLTALRGIGGALFEETTTPWGLDESDPTWGLLALDLEGDGSRELVATRSGWGGAADNTLWRRSGPGFIATPMAPAACGVGATLGATAADFDGDGDLDVALAAGSPAALAGCVSLLWNDTGSLTPAGDIGIGVMDGFGATTGDLDDDGHPDLVIVSGADGAVVYRNLGSPPWFALDVPDATLPHPADFALTSVLLDYDQDGDLDLFLCAWNDPRLPLGAKSQTLYRNDGDLLFTDVSMETGVAPWRGCMGVATGDLDLNGWPDLYLGTGGPEPGMEADNVLLLGDGGGAFVESTTGSGLALTGRSHGIALVDLDEDGLVDAVVNSGGAAADQREVVHILRNDGPAFPALAVELDAGLPDGLLVGSRIMVTTDVGSRHLRVGRGTGFGVSIATHRLLVGLGPATRVDDVLVRFPDGAEMHSGPLATLHAPVSVKHP